MTDIVEFIEARLAEREMWAREASRGHDGSVPAGGVHWQWATEADRVIEPEPGSMEYVDDDARYVYLSSVEKFETGSVGMLSQFAMASAEEVRVCAGGHIVRHDPAWVLRDIAAKRETLKRHRECGGSSGWCGDGGHGIPREVGRCLDLRGLAQIDETHQDYDSRWKAEDW